MAEADGIGAAAVATGRNDQVGGLVETVCTSSCDTLAVAEDERSELFATAPLEGAPFEASSSKYIDLAAQRRQLVQLPRNPRCSADDEYWTARRRRLEQQLWSECGSESEFEVVKSQEHWTPVGEPSSELDLVYVANRQHFQRLLDHDREREELIRRLQEVDQLWSLQEREIIVDSRKRGFRCRREGDSAFPRIEASASPECHWTVRTHNGLYHTKDVYSNCCFIESGTLLKDGRFAFMMERCWGDLRKLIDQNVTANNELGPPFSPSQALHIMYWIARGMANLHRRDILHKDLKASNVLIRRVPGHSFDYVVADFESSGGVRGTRFWRAPEVLQIVKGKVRDPSIWENIWLEGVDVYGYAMTSYEVLTGRIPLGHLAAIDYDVVLLKGERPLLPDYVDPRIQELLGQCWHSNPSQRPTFEEI